MGDWGVHRGEAGVVIDWEVDSVVSREIGGDSNESLAFFLEEEEDALDFRLGFGGAGEAVVLPSDRAFAGLGAM